MKQFLERKGGTYVGIQAVLPKFSVGKVTEVEVFRPHIKLEVKTVLP